MDKDFTVLYIGTGAMLVLSLSLIFFMCWATRLMNKHREFSEKRDKQWKGRIEGIESLVKNEFQELLKALKI